MSKVFDEKIAQGAEYQYTGVSGGTAWRQKMRNYLIGRCGDCIHLLKWAEQHQKRVITHEEVKSLRGEPHLVHDPDVVSAHLWTFLGLCLKDRAESLFNSGGVCGLRNGLEAWRKMYDYISDGVNLLCLTLRDQVYAPARRGKNADVPMAIVRWESQLGEFESIQPMGTPPMDAYSKKMTMLRILPKELQDVLLHRAMAMDTSYEHFRDSVTTRLAEQSYLAGRTGLHLIEEEEHPDHDDAVLAAAEKRGWKVVKPPGQKARVPGPPRPTSGTRISVSCINCGSTTHHTRDCTKDRVDPKDRPCFICGKKGHISRDCSENKGRPGQGQKNTRLHALEDDGEDRVLCCEDCAPASRTMGDYIFPAMALSNMFGKLACSHED